LGEDQEAARDAIIAFLTILDEFAGGAENALGEEPVEDEAPLELEDPLVSSFPDLPELPAIPLLKVLVIGARYHDSPRVLLIKEMTQIHHGGWYLSVILKPGCISPEPFKGNQGGGYTLEALLGVTANADKKPDKYGYEIKSFSGGKISLMTPVADAGYEGKHTFREFMKAYGRAGQANDTG